MDADACDNHILHLQNNIYQVLSNGKGYVSIQFVSYYIF